MSVYKRDDKEFKAKLARITDTKQQTFEEASITIGGELGRAMVNQINTQVKHIKIFFWSVIAVIGILVTYVALTSH